MTPSPHVPCFRFAPSPNGFLHLGHALSAMVGHDWARRVGGRFLLRIEDIDPVRSRAEFIAAAMEDLAWLGLTWDGPVRRQSAHGDDYRAATQRLAALGVLYPCFATRREIEAAAGASAARDPDGAVLYPGLHRRLSEQEVSRRKDRGEAPALRLDMGVAMGLAMRLVLERTGRADLTYTSLDDLGRPRLVTARPERWGDAVIVRKDCPTSYHLAVVVDDALQGITHVTRGADLEAATDLHRLLQVLLGLPAPLYHHHRLITDEAGAKLAKSRSSPALRELRASGWTACDVRRRLMPGQSLHVR